MAIKCCPYDNIVSYQTLSRNFVYKDAPRSITFYNNSEVMRELAWKYSRLISDNRKKVNALHTNANWQTRKKLEELRNIRLQKPLSHIC